MKPDNVFALVCVTSILALVFGVFGNVSTVWLVLRHNHLRRWPNAFHVSLALLDVLTLVTILPSLMVLTWPAVLTNHVHGMACMVFGISGIATSTSTVVTLSEISIVRFIRIFKSKKIIPAWFYIVNLLFPWCLGLTLAAVAYYTRFLGSHNRALCFQDIRWVKHPFTTVLIPVCLVSLLTITLAYTVIIIRLWLLVQNWKCGAVSVHPQHPHPTLSCQVTQPTSTSCHVISHVTLGNMVPVLRRNKEATVTSILIMCIFMMSYLPCLVLILVHKIGNTAPEEWEMVSVFLFTYLNSVLNPYVYALRKDVFKKQFVLLLKKLTCTYKEVKS